MEQGAPSAAGPAPRFSRPPAWIAALAVVIAYITLITDDTYLGPIPLKLFLVAGAIVAWWLQVGRRRALRDYQFAIPVLLFAIAIPVKSEDQAHDRAGRDCDDDRP